MIMLLSENLAVNYFTSFCGKNFEWAVGRPLGKYQVNETKQPSMCAYPYMRLLISESLVKIRSHKIRRSPKNHLKIPKNWIFEWVFGKRQILCERIFTKLSEMNKRMYGYAHVDGCFVSLTWYFQSGRPTAHQLLTQQFERPCHGCRNLFVDLFVDDPGRLLAERLVELLFLT